MTQRIKPGDWVIYRVQKCSTRPGRRATEVQPAPCGEDYTYHVDKFWTVVAVRPDGRIVIQTRRGKQRVLDRNDRRLRKANFWERLVWRSRFPALDDPS